MKIKGESLFFVGITAFVVIGFGTIFFLAGSKKEAVGTESLVRQNSQVLGSKTAQVTLVEFGDFQCPACKTVEPTLQTLRTLYKDRVKFVFRHFPLPFHSNALAASVAAEAAAEQGKFWDYHDLLYQLQSDWAEVADPVGKFKEYAKELSLDIKKFEQDYQSQALKDKVSSDRSDGHGLKVEGTPTFYLNGVKLSGNYNLDFFKAKIDDELADN